MKRVIEDMQDVYFNLRNKKTNKHIGAMQLMPREIKTFEVVFPGTAKKEVKKIIERICRKHNEGQNGGVGIHWGPWKKDKFKDGVEML